MNINLKNIILVISLIIIAGCGGEETETSSEAPKTVTPSKPGIETQIEPNPVISNYPQSFKSEQNTNNEAIAAASGFLSAWQARDWEKMVRYTQASWRSGEDNPASYLENWFGDLNLLGAEILENQDDSNQQGNMQDVRVRVYYAYPPIVRVETTTMRVVDEGSYGVNPISFTLKGRRGISLDAHDAWKKLKSSQ